MSELTPETLARDLAERFGATFVETIEAERVRDYLCALDEPEPGPGDPVPQLFLLALVRQRRPHLTQNTGGSGGVNAGDSLEFFVPVNVGDTITTTCAVKSIVETKSKSRDVLIATAEFTYHNQAGECVASVRTPSSDGSNHVRCSHSGRAASDRPRPIERYHLVELCAVENDYYPLHYDERQARPLGFDKPLIQGTYKL